MAPRLTIESVGTPESAAHLISGMWDERAWIVVGEAEACRGDDDPCGREAAIWTSIDGRTWARAELAGADSDWMSAVTRWGDAYYAASTQCGTGLFWRSTDAHVWEEVGSIDLGKTRGGECPHVEHLAGASDALVATLNFSTEIPSRVIRSADGANWKAVDPKGFGYPDDFFLFAADVVATGTSVTVVAGCGRGYCDTGVWRTRDGINWSRLDLINAGAGASTIARGDRLVIGTHECTDGQKCDIFLRAASDDGTFREVAVAPDMIRPQLAWTGDAYVLFGQGEWGDPDRPVDPWVSRDGLEWGEAPIDLGTCRVYDLIGGPSVALLVGSIRCGGLYLVKPS